MKTNWIKQKLKSMGVTQEQLAQAIGRDRAVVSRILQGRQPLRLDWAGAFARILQMSPEEFLRQSGAGSERTDAYPNAQKTRIIVGISGATGVIYGIRLLEILADLGIETHLVISRPGMITIAEETDYTLPQITGKAFRHYRIGDIAAPIASGSYRTLGMIVAPCSVRTMAEIATGVTSNLLTRAADVVLKERRRLVLMVRETPLHTGHLRTMTQLSEMGAIIAPPMPAFYTRPAGLADMVEHNLGRILDLFDLEIPALPRWGET
ncbi:MAG: UbiX family flavin prenyltransferase [Alphaproteobacteria bacterium]|nr:UbiX family flavin prenyltransferase [Alphaproteobacteria bacterium]